MFTKICSHISSIIWDKERKSKVLLNQYIECFFRTSIVTLTPTLCLSRLSCPMTFSKMCFPTWLSTADRGSSSRYTSASLYTARAKLTRCFWPPLRLMPWRKIRLWAASEQNEVPLGPWEHSSSCQIFPPFPVQTSPTTPPRKTLEKNL